MTQDATVGLTPAEIRELVAGFALRSSYGTEPNRDAVLALGSAVLPYFIEAYPKARRWQQRASFLYTAARHARNSPLAVKLAVDALQDRSREVRYRACLLLALSQDEAILPTLEAASTHADPSTRADVAAAIDAIRSRNPHFFVDRDHSGKVTYNFPVVEG